MGYPPGLSGKNKSGAPASSHQTFLTVTSDLTAETERRNRHNAPVPCKGNPHNINSSYFGAGIKTLGTSLPIGRKVPQGLRF
jgi:hypothetical protein